MQTPPSRGTSPGGKSAATGPGPPGESRPGRCPGAPSWNCKKVPNVNSTPGKPAPRHIAVLFHEQDRYRDPSAYLVHHLAGFWREDGHTVSYLYGTRRFVPADLALVHINLSVVPERYLEFASRYPIVLNGRIRDIRKSVVSTNLVRPGDPWDGPVIVKSDLNYAGAPERFLKRTWMEQRWEMMRSLRRRVERMRGVSAPFEESLDYKVFERIDDVPAHWFSNPDVIVEKFRPERVDGFYHVRIYMFLGDRWSCTRVGTPRHVVKSEPGARTETVEPAEEVVAWRRELGLDYGKLDYVVNDGNVVLLDVNKTTGASTYMDDETRRRNRRYQAEGIYSYFLS